MADASMHLGRAVEGDEQVTIDPADLTTHGVIVGMTGSGKTGLGVVLLEEALLSGVPTLVIDPKGDMANLCLRFPEVSAADLRPWIDEDQARREGDDPDAVAERTATRWREGLAAAGVDPERQRRLAAIPATVYTPGATTGVPLDLVGRLAPPEGADDAARQHEATDTASGLLALVGVDSDPLTGREHILVTNLLVHAWAAGTALDVPTLIAQVQQPPLRKLGVLDLETFFPAADRMGLAMRLNGLLASPTFAAWAQGVPLDLDAMLHGPDGSPRCAVVSIAHLDEAERQFVVTLLLSRATTWMRQQAGTSSLRALIYMDEVFGFVPPVGAPPAKQPILTILKQARAFGVGMVLATQNPVDLDYKAISNAGTWMIGRLQTEQDRARLLDGMRSADGAVDVAALAERISSLQTRRFVLHSARGGAPRAFDVRWAASYLAGPMTGPQISRLMADRVAAVAPPPPTATAAAAAQPAPAGAPTAPPPAPVPAADETTVAPPVPDDVVQRVLDPAAGWAAEVGAVPGGLRLEPWVALRVRLTFDETKADLDHTTEWEAVLPVPVEPTDLSGLRQVDHDERDLGTTIPEGAVYVLPDAKIGTKTWWASLGKAVRDHLHAEQHMTLLANDELDLWSRPGEDRAAFEARCAAAAEEAEDAEAAKIRARFETKADRVRKAVDRAQDKVAQLEADVSSRRSSELVNLGTSLLGGFLGGRRGARGVASDLRRAAGRRGQTSRTQQRLETAQGDVAERVEELEDLEDELADELLELDDRWAAAAEAITEHEIGLERTDVQITSTALVWVPTARG